MEKESDVNTEEVVIQINDNSSSDKFKRISQEEFEEYMQLKEKVSREDERVNKLSINDRIARELANAEDRERVEKQLLLEAEKINEIDQLAKAHLSKHFDKDTLLSKGYSLKEIMQAQRRELVRKFVPKEQIKAISKLDNFEHLDGEILEQLVSLAKVNISMRKRAASNIDSKHGDIISKIENRISLLDSGFSPVNFDEFNISVANAYKDRIHEFYNLKEKKTA
ncbi:DUF1357 family protein [Borrelia puertoricensis]|uniref:DUF1357 family protein n=1 Tax=Borrelia puertoricensis TaxID=2756107 RepID=UPI001FF4A332|nr:DUF1357 family protein [Borrelia puertoricensis]UPA18663.1 DUF1357 family protein [Borrelia puertoricensis]